MPSPFQELKAVALHCFKLLSVVVSICLIGGLVARSAKAVTSRRTPVRPAPVRPVEPC